ncbi:NUDIX domain-containing protein [Nocardia sp. NPDC049190]|uniref:NUDIX hydrolase n=1 Tax=Nocardia sp. NPDC049190 TaxID=3155650 RepID=UPI0033E09119
MEPATAVVAEIVQGITPLDALERQHRDHTLAWLAATDDIFRRHKPATPSPHLVAYVVPVDPNGRGVLLGRHRLSQLWLPPGGHVDPGEHPLAAAQREAHEEMGVEADFSIVGTDPVLLTVTSVFDNHDGHVDISLWYVIRGDRTQDCDLDPREFDGGRWWDIDRFGLPESDPHFARFVSKLEAALALRTTR